MEFSIETIISAYTGIQVSSKWDGAVYELVEFMTNDEAYTILLTPYLQECRIYLADQFPWLLDLTLPSKPRNQVALKNWVSEQKKVHGSTLHVLRIPQDDHTHRESEDVLSELRPDLQSINLNITPKTVRVGSSVIVSGNICQVVDKIGEKYLVKFNDQTTLFVTISEITTIPS